MWVFHFKSLVIVTPRYLILSTFFLTLYPQVCKISDIKKKTVTSMCIRTSWKMNLQIKSQSGHSILVAHMTKINPTVSENLCLSCKVLETVKHYLYDCDMYEEERDTLEQHSE